MKELQRKASRKNKRSKNWEKAQIKVAKRDKFLAKVDHKYSSQICPNCGTHTGKKPLSQRQHICPECNYQTTRDHAAAEILLQRGLEKVRMDYAERKLPDNGILSGLVCDWLDKCRYRNAQERS